jgi:aryl-alcohol dehydrogenase-like predicted oxidoreductase
VASVPEIDTECEKSLKRPRTNRIYLYYAHQDDYATKLKETIAAFDKLIKTGKVCMIGASNLNIWRIAEANRFSQANGWPQYSVVQTRYIYFRP